MEVFPGEEVWRAYEEVRAVVTYERAAREYRAHQAASPTLGVGYGKTAA